MSGAIVFLRSDAQQVLTTLETHHLPGIFVVAHATRAIRFSDMPYYQAVIAFVMTSMARLQAKPCESASASTKDAAKMVCFRG